MSASLIHAADRQLAGDFKDGDVLHVVSSGAGGAMSPSQAQEYVQSLLRESGADVGLEVMSSEWAGRGFYRNDVYNVTLRLKPDACKHCLKPEDWHDEVDGACPDDDDGPHPNSSAALSMDVEPVEDTGTDPEAWRDEPHTLEGDQTKREIMSEDWLLENLPHGWTYDCRFKPEMAFLIYSPEDGPFVIPLRLLAKPE